MCWDLTPSGEPHLILPHHLIWFGLFSQDTDPLLTIQSRRGGGPESYCRGLSPRQPVCVGVTEEGFKQDHVSRRLQEGLPADPREEERGRGDFIRCLGTFDHRVPLSSPHSGLWCLTSHLVEWKQLMGHGNKQTRMGARETEDICSSIIGLISVTWLCAEHFGSGLSALHKAEVWLPWSCGMKGCGGKMGFMLPAVAVVSLGDRQLLLPLQTHFPTTVSQMILSDCFSTWAMNNTRAGIHLRSVFSFFSSGNGNEPVLSCRALCTLCVSSGTAKQTTAQCSQRAVHEASCRKKAAPSPYLLCSGQCVWQPHLQEKVSNITEELIYTGAHLLHCSWSAGALSHHPHTCSGGCKRLR